MNLRRELVFAAFVVAVLLPVRPAFAADDLDKVLHQLDTAAASFRTTSADFEFDSVQTDPFPDTDVQKGSVYYQRDGKVFKTAAHIREFNGKPVPKIYMYADGMFKLYEPMNDLVTTFKQAGKFESYVMLGFGASGKELADKWTIKYLGQETVDGVKTDKLELVAKDPAVRKNIPKVTIWLDTERAISLRQVFDQGAGQSRNCHYFNVKVNDPLPADAFKFKTDSKTQFVDR